MDIKKVALNVGIMILSRFSRLFGLVPILCLGHLSPFALMKAGLFAVPGHGVPVMYQCRPRDLKSVSSTKTKTDTHTRLKCNSELQS